MVGMAQGSRTVPAPTKNTGAGQSVQSRTGAATCLTPETPPTARNCRLVSEDPLRIAAGAPCTAGPSRLVGQLLTAGDPYALLPALKHATVALRCE